MAPSSMKSREDIAVAIMAGLEVGLKPMQALQSIAVINGRPCIWGDAALGLVMASGEVESFSERIDGEGDKMVAICIVHRKGFKEPTEKRFSVEDAKTAKLWAKISASGKPSPWVLYPKRMLQMRARSWALRDTFPDILKGLQVHEEVQDYSHLPADRPEQQKLSAKSVIDQANGDGDAEEPEEVEDADFDEPTDASETEAEESSSADDAEERPPEEADTVAGDPGGSPTEAPEATALISGELIDAMSNCVTVEALDAMYEANQANIKSYTESAQAAVQKIYDTQREKLIEKGKEP